MSAPARKGWCPSLFEPMASGDGLIVRLKPHAATVEAAAVRAIAEAAARYGNGIVEVTNRANLQLRGVRAETVAPITAMATRLRLTAGDPAVERIRSVVASPLGRDDPGAAWDSHALALDLERMLESEPRLAALPAKFGFLVDGGGALPLAGLSADIVLRPADGAVEVTLGGGARAAACSTVEAVSAARRLALAFVALAAHEPARRMRDLVRAVGDDRVFAEAGLAAVAARPEATPGDAAQPIGFVPLGTAGAFGIGLPFGQVEAATLASIADLAARYGDGTLRVTPWRAVLLVGVAATDVAGLAARSASLGLITDPADPRRAIAACPGKPACSSATVETRVDAARLAARGPALSHGVHVSGCAKGCAHPGPAALTLVGRGGAYDVVLDGRAGDAAVAHGLGLDDALSLFDRLRSGASR